MVFAAYPTNSGNLVLIDIDTFLPQLVNKAKQTNTKVIMSIGGAGLASKGFVTLTLKSENQQRFVDNVAKLVERYQLDGIDIDFTLDRGFEAHKILIGLPTYGIHFKDGNVMNTEQVGYNNIVAQMKNDLSKITTGKQRNLF